MLQLLLLEREPKFQSLLRMFQLQLRIGVPKQRTGMKVVNGVVVAQPNGALKLEILILIQLLL
jgi:hypothetical protein